MTSPGLGATSRVTPHDQRLTVFAEISGIACFFGNLPQTGQANPIWMEQATKALSV
jgi:hypothetical protein